MRNGAEMKKMCTALSLITGCLAFLGSCTKTNSTVKESGQLAAGKENNEVIIPVSENNKILIAYFSHSGNTRIIADQIKNATGGDIFEIKPLNDYPDDYQTVADQAKKEIKSNFKPELKTNVNNMDEYSVIFIGSPNWWNTIAPPVATFLSSNNFSGKKIIPFITYGGTGLGHSVSDIEKLCSNSTVLEGFSIKGSKAKGAQGNVMRWLRKIKMVNSTSVR